MQGNSGITRSKYQLQVTGTSTWDVWYGGGHETMQQARVTPRAMGLSLVAPGYEMGSVRVLWCGDGRGVHSARVVVWAVGCSIRRT